MEIAATGFGVAGLVALFGTCLKTLEMLSSAARYGRSYAIITVKLDVEKARFTIWGQHAGLIPHELGRRKRHLRPELQREHAQRGVAGLLACFLKIFEDAKTMKNKYGISKGQEEKEDDDENAAATSNTAMVERPSLPQISSGLRRAYERLRLTAGKRQNGASFRAKAQWAVVDESRFRTLVDELKRINDSLASFVPAIQQKTRVTMRDEILRSQDREYLQRLIEHGDTEYHRLVSETASFRLEILSGAPSEPTSRPENRDNEGAVAIHKVVTDEGELHCYTWLVEDSAQEEEPVCEAPQSHDSFSTLPFFCSLFKSSCLFFFSQN